MMLESVVRDCLYLNWALPAAALPPPPAPLRYQLHPFQGEDHAFASAVLFHQEGLHLQSLPRLRLSYPQCNLRLYVLDGDGVPAVLFRSMLMPLWVVPGVRLVSAQPAASARFRFPRPSSDLGDGEWRWWVEKGEALEVRAWQDSPAVGHGPRLGSWEQTVEYISERPRGYVVEDGALHRVKAQHPRAAVWPLRAEISALGLLTSLLPLTHGASWPPLHSSWLCPEIPFVFDLGLVPKMTVAPSLPQAAASRSAARSAARIALPESGYWLGLVSRTGDWLREAPEGARPQNQTEPVAESVAREAHTPATPPLPAREEEVCHA